MSPLLSICIPAYNRADMLDKVLTSIVTVPEFLDSDDVEVIVSDNCSADDTPRVCRHYSELFPGKIHTFRQTSEINGHFNFKFVLDRGRGEFLKLHNDNTEFLPGMLSRYLEAIRSAEDGIGFIIPDEGGDLVSNDPEELLSRVGISITWISNFCIRRSIYENLPDSFRAWPLFLPQLDIFLRVVASGYRVKLVQGTFFHRMHVVYNRFTQPRNDALIFGRNYFDIVESVFPPGTISPATLSRLKKEILYRHIIPYHFDFFGQYFLKRQSGYVSALWKHYRKEPFFYTAFLYIAFYFFVTRIIPLHQLCGKIKRRLISARHAE